ncbi:hypothetical protein HHI36_019916 [Cryptolaemus montrouzieri]|uniref:Uncharacterized protein n=1 Tax=Cryptolaemus montrouzieri TaxID=559131 RepID=A0ABD2N920_9CUCU
MRSIYCFISSIDGTNILLKEGGASVKSKSVSFHLAMKILYRFCRDKSGKDINGRPYPTQKKPRSHIISNVSHYSKYRSREVASIGTQMFEECRQPVRDSSFSKTTPRDLYFEPDRVPTK